MQVVVDLSVDELIKTISNMNLQDVEKIKKSLIERELYFKPFIKDDIEDIISDFEKEGYSDDFLKDLEEGLKKSSVYEN